MGWANCGEDSQGRQIGYAHSAVCDEPGCKVEIDRGLSYACGDMHGDDAHWCERYFCGSHLFFVRVKGEERGMFVCRECRDQLSGVEPEYGQKCPFCRGPLGRDQYGKDTPEKDQHTPDCPVTLARKP